MIYKGDHSMACFLVPTTEAIVTTVIKKVADNKGSDNIFIKKMGWLNNMLWGGAALLAFEHVWHGEVTPWFPFLTAASNVADAQEMLHEMFTSGVAMAVLVTLAWVVMVLVAQAISKKKAPAAAKAKA